MYSTFATCAGGSIEPPIEALAHFVLLKMQLSSFSGVKILLNFDRQTGPVVTLLRIDQNAEQTR
jgi:hypothetical protein